MSSELEKSDFKNCLFGFSKVDNERPSYDGGKMKCSAMAKPLLLNCIWGLGRGSLMNDVDDSYFEKSSKSD